MYSVVDVSNINLLNYIYMVLMNIILIMHFEIFYFLIKFSLKLDCIGIFTIWCQFFFFNKLISIF